MKTIEISSIPGPYTVAQHTQAHTQAHTERTPSAHPAHTPEGVGAHPPQDWDDSEGVYSAKDLSVELGIASSTLRTRWTPHLEAAVGRDRVKVAGKFTELARHLFQRYAREVAAVDGSDGKTWAEAIANEYPALKSAEVYQEEERPYVPADAGALAVRQHHSTALEQQSDRVDTLAERLQLAKAYLAAEDEQFKAQMQDQQVLSAEEQDLLTELELMEYRRRRRAHYERLRQIDAEERARSLGNGLGLDGPAN